MAMEIPTEFAWAMGILGALDFLMTYVQVMIPIEAIRARVR